MWSLCATFATSGQSKSQAVSTRYVFCSIQGEVILPPELPALDGVLALKSFTDLVVTFDWTGDRLTLESVGSAEARRAEARPATARSATGLDGSELTVLLAAEAAPEPVWLLLDSGNLLGTIVSAQGARHLRGGEAGAVAGQSTTVDLQLVGQGRRATQVLVRDIIYDGVLGASFFLDNVLTLDLRGRAPWVGVEPRAP